MKIKDEFCLILCTCPDIEVAKFLAELLISEHLAACVNLFPNVLSVYAWEGKVETSEEVQLLIKTRLQRFDAVSDLVKVHHPYAVPELLSIPVIGGDKSYLAWIRGWVGASQEHPDGESTV